jgi:hypothetical protein
LKENAETKNLKVKHLAVYTLFPLLVNKTASAISSIESDHFMSILESAFEITWGDTRDEKERCFIPLLKQHIGLITSQGIILRETDDIETFTKLVKTLRKVYKQPNESLKRDGMKTLRMYL